MKWDLTYTNNPDWFNSISNRENKEMIAKKVSTFLKDGDVVGVGSGSTSYLALLELVRKSKEEKISFQAIPTSKEMEMACIQHGVPIVSLISAKPNWGFDGADEVDSNFSLIKGRGGALFREKLVMKSSPKTYILVDKSKFVSNLGEKFAVPIEIFPESLSYVESELIRIFGERIQNISIRKSIGKDGPVITENNNFLIDVRFHQINLGDELFIKHISGVIDSGLFIGYPIEIIDIS